MEYTSEDHPMIRTLFFIGMPTYVMLEVIISGDLFRILMALAIGGIGIWAVKKTNKFHVISISTNDIPLMIASLFAYYGAIMGGIVIAATLVGIPWLIRGIKNDLTV